MRRPTPFLLIVMIATLHAQTKTAKTADTGKNSAVFFHNFGETFSTLGDANVRVPVKLRAIIAPIRRLRESILSQAHVAYSQLSKRPVTPRPPPTTTYTPYQRFGPYPALQEQEFTPIQPDRPVLTREQYNADSDLPFSRIDFGHIRTLDNAIQRLVSYQDLGTPLSTTETSRQVRWAPLAVFPLIQTLLGAHNNYQIEQLKQNASRLTLMVSEQGAALSAQGQVVGRLVNVTESLVFGQTRQDMQLLHGSLVTEAVEITSRVADTIEALLQQRLSPAALAAGEADTVVQHLQAAAKKQGYRLLVKNKADIFQCPTSFLADAEGFDVFVHIPIAQHEDSLMLYRFLPIPARLSPNSAMVFAPAHDVLALSHNDESFQIMHMADLAQCTRKGTTYLCENSNVIRTREGALTAKDDPTNCLYFLMVRNYEAVRTSCPVHLSKVRDGAFQLDQTRFVFQNRKNEQGTTRCASTEHPERWSADSSLIVTVPPGCWAETSSFRVTSTRSIPLSARASDYYWDEPIDNLFGDVDLDQFEDMRRQLTNVSDVPRSLAGIASWLRGHQETTITKHFSWGALSLAGLAVVVCIGGFGLSWWWSRKIAGRFGITVRQLYRHLLQVAAARAAEHAHNIRAHLPDGTQARRAIAHLRQHLPDVRQHLPDVPLDFRRRAPLHTPDLEIAIPAHHRQSWAGDNAPADYTEETEFPLHTLDRRSRRVATRSTGLRFQLPQRRHTIIEPLSIFTSAGPSAPENDYESNATGSAQTQTIPEEPTINLLKP